MKITSIQAPTTKEKISIRSLILVGLLSVINFFYWFLNFDLIEDQILYWLLLSVIFFDTFRIIYIWYHYWDISVPKKPLSKISLTVDVFTTYFPGEPKTMLLETLLAIKAMSYPHTAYLCDEANDEELKQFCLEHDILHVTRTNRIDAKAGNINNALKQATGEICLILDPDHVPKVNFLEEIIPYFEDGQVGFVQTVQSYYNINESKVAQAAAEQTFHFYGPVMMCMNSYGTVNAIGANCVFRRSALDSIGGHAAGLSEDLHTAMRLHAKGWKSLYVPDVLSAGLAPATLTAFFKQQLKWSRGTLELLFTSYPKLFPKLSFRQKLHYGILPLHYLTGLVYMISFLIPIISLLTSTTPWKGNMLDFGLITFPVIASILGIRFYAQKWVINKGERGMHLLGGILMQITWSIYMMGLFYTLIRKKVPYLPTAKENEGKTSFYIVLPNLVIFGVCILSIAYGLFRDFTPFSLFMSGFALWNALLMLYTLRFAYQVSTPVRLDLETVFTDFNLEHRFEKFIFMLWQKSALITLTLTLIICGIVNLKKRDFQSEALIVEAPVKKSLKYLGVFAPIIDNGLSNFSKISEFESTTNQKSDVVSYYIAWNTSIDSTFPNEKIRKTYSRNSIPMITWEPWSNLILDKNSFNVHIFNLINEGKLDNYIEKFALKIKELNRPVFLRFAHEFDNPFYPWYDDREEAGDNFKNAWRHTWEVFERVGANNAIWVYNPWKADKLTEFFPGNEYVDWIGVNILNYATHEQVDLYYSFKELYKPFHDEIEKLGNYPVMIAEFGSVKEPVHQVSWLNEAIFDMNNEFTEIDAIVYFNSNVDDNLPKNHLGTEAIDWTLSVNSQTLHQFKTEQIPSFIFEPFQKNKLKGYKRLANIEKLKKIKGVNLKNGHHWNRDYYVLNRKNLEYDLSKIKGLGLNTIKYTSNRIYDYNVINVSKEFGLQLAIGFWIPDDIDIINNTDIAAAFKVDVIECIKKYKNQNHIVSWNLQHGRLSTGQGNIHKPLLTYQNTLYINWLEELISNIKSIDPERPLIMELVANNNAPFREKELRLTIEGIDGIGLTVEDDSDPTILLKSFESWKIPYVYADISLDMLDRMNVLDSGQSFFITNWRDQHQIDKLTFDGLVDRKGRYKAGYFQLGKELHRLNNTFKQPSIRILKTLVLLESDDEAFYFAMMYDSENGWQRIKKEDDLKLEWALVKCDSYGNYITIKEVGDDPVLLLNIPYYYETYRLRLTVIKGDVVNSTMTTLNTPYNN